jgi:hypothetical protein
MTEHLKRELPKNVLSWCMYQNNATNVQAVVEPVRGSKSVREESKDRLPDFPDYVYRVICTAPS